MKGAELSEVQGVEEPAPTASQQLLEKHLMQYADLLSQQPQRHTQRQIWEQQQAEVKQQQQQQEQEHLDRLRQQKRLEFLEMKKSQLVKQSSEDSLSEREHAVEQSDSANIGQDGPIMAPQPIGGERRQPYLTTRSSPLLPPHAFTLEQQPNHSVAWGYDKPMRLGGEAADVWGPMIGGAMYSEPMHSNQAHLIHTANGNLQNKVSESGSSNHQQRLGMPVPFNPYAHPASQYPPGYMPTGHPETSLTHTDPGNGYSYAAEGPEPYTMWSTDDGDPIIPGIPLPGGLFPTFLPSFESNSKTHLMGGSNIQPASMAARMPPFPWTVNPQFPPPGPPPSTVPIPPQHMVTNSGDSSFPSGWPDRELNNAMGLDGTPFPPRPFEGSSSVPIKSAIATPPEPAEYENIRKIWGSPSPSSQCVSVWDVNRKSWGSPSDSSFTPPKNHTGLEIVDEAKALGAKLVPLSVGQKSTDIDWSEACLQQENLAKLQSCSLSLADMDPSIINAYTKKKKVPTATLR